MKRELFLHIGTTKTGSTSIQNVLKKNRAALLDQGVCYPTTPGLAQHTMLTYAIMSPHERARRFRSIEGKQPFDGSPEQRIAVFADEFAEEMRLLPDTVRRVILSSETIYVHLRKAEEVRRLHDLLQSWFEPIKVVVYLRRQDAHLISLYTQMLRAGAVCAPHEFEIRARPMHEIDYAELLNRWAGAFGNENILPRIFQRGANKPFNVVTDFFECCGISIDDGAAAMGQSNPSVELPGQQLLADLGNMIQSRTGTKSVASPAWRRLTAAVTSARPGPGWKPKRAVAQEFYEQYRESNETVRREWFPDRVTLFDEDFSDYPEDEMQATQEQLYSTACRTILALADPDRGRGSVRANNVIEQAKADGDKHGLRAALRRAIRADEENVALKLMLADLLIESGNLPEARTLAAAALQLMPDNTTVREFNEKVLSLHIEPAPPPAPNPTEP